MWLRILFPYNVQCTISLLNNYWKFHCATIFCVIFLLIKMDKYICTTSCLGFLWRLTATLWFMLAEFYKCENLLKTLILYKVMYYYINRPNFSGMNIKYKIRMTYWICIVYDMTYLWLYWCLPLEHTSRNEW